MTTLPEQIAEKFLDELSQSDEISEEQIQALRELLEAESKMKATDIESTFSSNEDSTL